MKLLVHALLPLSVAGRVMSGGSSLGGCLRGGEEVKSLIARQCSDSSGSSGSTGSLLSGLLGSLGGLGGFLAGPKKPAKIITVIPRIRPEAKRELLLWGPYNFKPANPDQAGGHSPLKGLPGMQMDPNGQLLAGPISGFCTDCTVLHGTAYVANADGSRADLNSGAYLHHLVIASGSRYEQPYFKCSKNGAPPSRPSMSASYFLGAGVDQSEYYFTTTDGKYNSGYYLSKSANFMNQAEVVNYNNKTMEWYIAAEYEWIPGRPAGLEDMSVTDINVNGCNAFLDPGYMPPKGSTRYNMTSPKFIMDKDGVFLHTMGHLHDGGVKITLSVNDRLSCDSSATYGGKQGTLYNADGSSWETISSMSTCRDPVHVKKGDVLSMVSVYDTELHPLRHANTGEEMEEMGIFTLFFVEKKNATKT